jgi:predicted ATPase/class 3 adenylate cyclase
VPALEPSATVSVVGVPPSGTVTFLFTDIEGSTRLWEERPEDMRALVAEHDERIRAAIEGNGGYVVKATGDGFHAAFGRAADAVTAAVEGQAAMVEPSAIKVRMGINTGEVQERDGDYFGPPVNRAARLMAAGHGGQVLIAGVTAELVPGLVLRNLGEHRLRDLGAPMPIWQLGTGEFPPLRTLDELPGNLPVQRTSFIGRTEEVKALAALVQTEALVTLTGLGGVGKSRMALQVAADLAPAFRGGAWFASLSSLEEGALVATTILEAIGVPERRGEPSLDTLCSWARTNEALMVIDNCEHLLADVADVADRLVDASTTLTILTTSQEPLGVRGEHVWTVVPLSGPHEVARDSVELFVDRARMARADFALTDENEAAVAEICDRLDNVPLAIELAAARVRGMSPADISRRLDQRLRLFASGDRAAPGRHRTLDAAVRWSYELLDDTQQQIFDRLAAFAGPFTIDAAEAVVAGDGVEEWEVLDGVLALVEKSLVLADDSTGATRYRLLETMRQFGSANLAAARSVRVYRERHADHFAEYVLSRRSRLHGSGDQPALEEIMLELENIRVALRHAADDHDSRHFEEMFCCLFPLWLGRGRTLEGATWAAELPDRPDLDARMRIVALGFGAIVMNNSDLAVAHAMAEAAEALSASTGASPPLLALTVRGIGALMQGRADAALACCDRVIALAADEPDLFVRAQSLASSAAVFATCGAVDRLDALERDLAPLLDELGNRFLAGSFLNSVAPILYVVDPEHAGERLLRTYESNIEIGNDQANTGTCMFLALNELRGGDASASARWARQSLQLAVEYAPAFIPQVIDLVVAIVKRRSRPDAAGLLGALRAHRTRHHQVGTQPEIDAEVRYESSLRRSLGETFDSLYAKGAALDEAAMLALAFEQLDKVGNESPGGIDRTSASAITDLRTKGDPGA